MQNIFYNELYVHVLRTCTFVTVKNPGRMHGYSGARSDISVQKFG